MDTKYIDINNLNKKVITNKKELIKQCESKFKNQLQKVAERILNRKTPVKIILLAGPSCAGKTTSANMLKDILRKSGKNVLNIGMDNFFISKALRPKLPNGSIDFDSINIVNLDLIEQTFTELFEKGKVKLPVYDFINGVSLPNMVSCRANENTIIILEGIHVLNPKLIAKLGTKHFYKIFINNCDGYKFNDVLIEPRDFRMVRRMIRDAQMRAVNMKDTVKHWHDVTDAEDQYILPFADTANTKINTSHEFEPCLYKNEILKAVKANELSYKTVPWLKVFEDVEIFDKDLLPKNTLMKEFIDLDD